MIKKINSFLNKILKPLVLEVHEEKFYNLKSDTILWWLGEPKYRLIIKSTTKKKSYLRSGKYEINIFSAEKSLLTSKEIYNLISKFFRKKARIYLDKQVKISAEKINANYERLAIKDTVTRWGSCSNKKNLNFCWRIMLAPKKIVDYLVVHEVCHLKEMNHGSKFWLLVESLDSDYKKHDKWLKVNGKFLCLGKRIPCFD